MPPGKRHKEVLKAADILAVRVTTVRDGTADLSARVGLRGVTLLVGDAASAFHWP